MGIPGILKEIGKGERVALAKLAVEHFEQSQRPFRIAIDAAIWNFQNQAGQGGRNPALRTLFYRLLKLLALPIQPVFVYDGKNRPLTKRGKTVSRYGTCVPNETSKKLIQAFQFPHHTAPGEAEAECAMLQRKGLVDAVMSQDVDAIMFGSTLTLRDWSKEASKHNKTPTHVNVLDLPRIKDISGLDPDGMILVALLSGGDYDEAGMPGFGPGLSCEVARANFGKDLLDLVRSQDEKGIVEWRERLQYELESNESGYFKTKHKTLTVPDTFPDRRVLGYYMDPAISSEDQLPVLEKKWQSVWKAEVDVKALRDYVADTFDWCYKPGAWKFVRVLAPALLADGLRRGFRRDIAQVDQITERRKHFTSDGIPELRVTVIPADVVGLDLDLEEDSPEYLERLAAEEQDLDNPAGDVVEENLDQLGPSKTRKTTPWLPHNPEKIWIAEAVVHSGAREQVEAWHRIQKEIEADPKKFATRKCRKQNEQQKSKRPGGTEGALLDYMIEPRRLHEKALPVKASTTIVEEATKGTKQRRAPRTPTKRAIQRAEAGNSPVLQSYFKVTKNSSQIKSSQQDSDIVEKASQEFKDELEIRERGEGGGAGKPSRPSTSTSNSSDFVHKAAVKKSKKIFRIEGKAHIKTPTDYRSAPALACPENMQESRKSEGGGLNNILIVSPPVIKEDIIIESTISQASLDGSSVTEGVATRTNRRTKRAIKDSIPENTSGINRSPQRARRPIESFFAPYIAAAEQNSSAATNNLPQIDLPVAPSEPNTGLRTTFSSSHIHAVPRSSLPGTWKEVRHVSPESSQDIPRDQRSGSRMSIVDLTGS